jgi:hypothetical protein
MPEISLYEYRDFGLPQNEVRTPRQIACVFFKYNIRLPQQICDDKLWLRALAANARHQCASLLRAHDVATVKPHTRAFLSVSRGRHSSSDRCPVEKPDISVFDRANQHGAVEQSIPFLAAGLR